VAIASSSNLFLQIKDVLSKTDINNGVLEIDMSHVFHSVLGFPGASEELTL
jgi:hypothetical protein